MAPTCALRSCAAPWQVLCTAKRWPGEGDTDTGGTRFYTLSFFLQPLRAANHRSVALLPRQWYRAPRHQTACHSAGQQGELGTCEIGRFWLRGPVGRGSNDSAAAARYINSVLVLAHRLRPTIDAVVAIYFRLISFSLGAFCVFICFAVPQCARRYFLPVICQMWLISVLFSKWGWVRIILPRLQFVIDSKACKSALGNQHCQVSQDKLPTPPCTRVCAEIN